MKLTLCGMKVLPWPISLSGKASKLSPSHQAQNRGVDFVTEEQLEVARNGSVQQASSQRWEERVISVNERAIFYTKNVAMKRAL